MGRMIEYIYVNIVALALVVRAHGAQQANWSIVDANGVGADAWGGDTVEKCALDELRFRFDVVVPVSDLRIQRGGEAHSNIERMRVPLEIVRVDLNANGDDQSSVVHRTTTEVTIQLEQHAEANNEHHTPDAVAAPPAIECAYDSLFCVPKIVGIRLPDVGGDDGATLATNHSIILQFADATNRPDASSRQAIETFVAFPTYIGDELEGVWSDDKTLVIVVKSLDETRILPLQELMAALVHTTLLVPESASAKEDDSARITGDVRLRVQPRGGFAARLVVGDSVVDSPVFRVVQCGAVGSDAIVVLDDETLASSVTSNPVDSPFPEPVVFIDGVLSHSGSEAFTLRHSRIAMEDYGSWSVNLWLLTTQDATGKFRTLFFNGDGSGQHRTPSAWFRPDDRRLVLRVSTHSNMDVGLDSVGEIPLDTWVNIGLTFRNCSTGIDANATVDDECRDDVTQAPKPWFYSMKLFVNGVIDQQVLIFEPVLPNAGPLHIAKAAAGRKEAFMALATMYANGDDEVPPNKDVAAYHYVHTADDASATYHARGKQPLHEMNRLYDGIEKEDELRKGQLGDDDELIQYQKMRADKDGDVDAMANMGDLYYWGARGLARDHEQAYSYFHRAAQHGHTSAQSAVAGMLLKGEGTQQNNASAIEWYEKAAKKNHTRALNGLGFIHFHGSGGMEENKTLALEFFERAAANMEDGDSVFNAGYCHAFGLGTARNITRAMEYYKRAARRFGHFDAIHELGKIYWNGWEDQVGSRNGVIRPDSGQAIAYLKAASEGGTWGRSVRTGFELFLAGEFAQAAVVYYEASEYGYRVATSNLAYVHDQKLLQAGNAESERLALHHLRRASERNGDKEVLVRIGDFYFYGMGGLRPNAEEALRWYSRASAEGVEAGAYNVGHMHEYGLGVPVNYDRAERYYKRVLDLAPPKAVDKQIAVQLALLRLRGRKWLSGVSRGNAFGGSSEADEGESPSQLPSLPAPESSWLFASALTTVLLALFVASVCAWLVKRQGQRGIL